jgi:hypothetical protein
MIPGQALCLSPNAPTILKRARIPEAFIRGKRPLEGWSHRHNNRPCALGRKTDMHTLTINDNERTLLIEILESCLAKLPHEIHQTDNHAYSDMLEEKRSTLQQLLKRLQES